MQNALAWLQSNWVPVVGPALVLVIDWVIGRNPNWKANGILHGIELLIKNSLPQSQPPAQ
jgi:hypothetical protein